jgi:hypothetical protein
MKTITDYINNVNENKFTEFFKKGKSKDETKKQKYVYKSSVPPSDAVKQLPAEAVLRIAVVMFALMSDNYYTSLPSKKEAEHMYNDTEYLGATLGYDNADKYVEEIHRIMKACYLGYADKRFASNFVAYIGANYDGWATLDQVMDYKK